MFQTRLRAILGFAVFLALAVDSQPVQAQGTDMSVDAMSQAFAKQKSRLKTRSIAGAATKPGAGQVVRGLVLAPTNAPGLPATAATASVKAQDFVMVPKDEQVNINISFDFDSAALREDQKQNLAALCTSVKTAGVERLRILGHTDAAGSDDYNARLSLLRAEEVRRHLAETCAIPLDSMEAVGMGKQFLFDPAQPRGEVNRRVEFQALG